MPRRKRRGNRRGRSARGGVGRAAVERTRDLPATLAAAIALDAWTALAPLEHDPGRGRLAVAALLVAGAKARAHLPALSVGLRLLPRARRHNSHDAGTRLVVGLEAIAAAATAGLADHERWSTARELLARKCANRRTSSRLPALVELVLATPMVTASMVSRALRVSERGALDLVAALGLREMTGRGRYRAWGILWAQRRVRAFDFAVLPRQTYSGALETACGEGRAFEEVIHRGDLENLRAHGEHLLTIL